MEKKLKKGSILSEISFFKVDQVLSNGDIVCTDDNGNSDITIQKAYVDDVLFSSSDYETEELKTMTELAEIAVSNPNIVMEIAFIKKDEVKTKKVYEAEKAVAIDKVRNAKVSEVDALLNDLIDNPISKVTPGELRVMKGRHHGAVNNLERISFVDMEQTRKNADYDDRTRQVDTRTIQWIILKGVKYKLKK